MDSYNDHQDLELLEYIALLNQPEEEPIFSFTPNPSQSDQLFLEKSSSSSSSASSFNPLSTNVPRNSNMQVFAYIYDDIIVLFQIR